MRKTHTYQEREDRLSLVTVLEIYKIIYFLIAYVRMYLVFTDILFAYTVANVLKIFIGKRLDMFPGKKWKFPVKKFHHSMKIVLRW